jgi:thioredoxin reductase (NADPH)
VYAASEGLATVLLELEAFGGQAGTSSRIRNYLGFPRGISGADLAWRAYEQAWTFGTHFIYGNLATSLATGEDLHVVGLKDGSQVRSRAVIIATGASYRRLGIAELESLAGAGVFYGASTIEAQAVAGKPVFVVGGGNSAGQPGPSSRSRPLRPAYSRSETSGTAPSNEWRQPPERARSPSASSTTTWP